MISEISILSAIIELLSAEVSHPITTLSRM